MAEETITKICSKCKEVRLLSEFAKQKGATSGIRSQCKHCDKEYRKANAERIAAYDKIYQKEYAKNNRERLRARLRDYYLRNKEKTQEWFKEHGKQYRQENKVAIAVRSKRYRDKTKKQQAEYSKKYRQDNKERIAAYCRKHRQTPEAKDNHIQSTHKRRALQLGATVEKFHAVDVFKRDGYKCQLCGRKTRPDYKNCNLPLYPNLDHIVPLSKGGEHSKKNTQCLCRECNVRKHNSGTGDQLRLFG